MAEVRAAAPAGLAWVLLALGVAVIAQVRDLPGWVTLAFTAALGWRHAAARRDWSLPPRTLRLLLALVATLAVYLGFRTLNGVEAGTALLAMMAAVKLLETRTARDLTVLVFISYFLIFAALLRNQALTQLPLALACTVTSTAALLRVHSAGTESIADTLRRTGTLLWPALPLAAALFLLFPRLPGPFWGIAASEAARSGLNDEMTPGDVSELSLSGDVAFRVRFDRALPPPRQRYWRGPVLHEFDGRTWRRPRMQAFPEQPVAWRGAPVDYQITLEPHNRPWILALDLPAEWPEREARRSYDFQLVAPRLLTAVSSYRLRSYTDYAAGVALPVSLARKDLQLPPSGNPRAVALGRELAARHSDPTRIVADMLQRFRDQPYVYTLNPPRLADDAVDEFLFSTRSGYCEHYAAAFTVVMRAAGIPARVVTGYQGGAFNPYGGYLIVRQEDAHAWSEIWIKGRGWLRVDPTAAVAPERIERGVSDAIAASRPALTRLLQGGGWIAQGALAWDLVNAFWNERIVRFNAAQQFALLERLGVDDPDWRSLGLGLTAALAAFFVALSVWLAWAHRRPALDWPARLHAEAARRLARRGVARGAAEGPVDFLDRAAQGCPDLEADLAEIRELYVALRYGPQPRPDDLRRLKLRVNRLRA